MASIGILDRFASLPDGLRTEVRERGSRFSAGEKQLVSLARAALADPEILVLDEATSSLDPGTEAMVEEAMERLSDGRTTIVIAHRLTTAARADRVAVVAAGCLAEVGTHDELIGRDGHYAALFAAWAGELAPTLVAMALDPDIAAQVAHLFDATLAQVLAGEVAGPPAAGPMHGDDVADRRRHVAGPAGPVRVRLYRPATLAPASAAPALVWAHGGGWQYGDLDMPEADSVAQVVAAELPGVVVSVDYRLAPEHPVARGPRRRRRRGPVGARRGRRPRHRPRPGRAGRRVGRRPPRGGGRDGLRRGIDACTGGAACSPTR